MTFPLVSVGPQWLVLAKRGRGTWFLLLAGCFLAVPLVGYGIHGRGLMAEIAFAEARQDELEREWQARAAEAESLTAYRQHVQALAAELEHARRKLFVDDGLAGLLHDLGRQGEGVKLEQVTVLDSSARPHYIGLPIEVRASGGYLALQRFLSGLAGLDRLVTLEALQISADDGALQIQARLQAYRSVQAEANPESVVQWATEPRDPFVASGLLTVPLEQAALVGHLRDKRGLVALVRVGRALYSLREGDALGPERVVAIDDGRVELMVPEGVPRVLYLGAVVEG